MVMLWLVGCATQVGDPPLVEEPVMAPVDALVRASLDLRGVRPSLDEIAAVEGDPGFGEGSAFVGLVDTFLDDPRYEGRVRDLWAEIYLTRAPSIYVNAATCPRMASTSSPVDTWKPASSVSPKVAAFT